jgi:glycosyltransferase involved in cell wall biosynthesis
MPEVSVIIPAYNAELTILETIQSVQQQTFDDFELIIINDGSKDKTLELIQAIQDKRLKVFCYENGGLPVARNRGIAHATGKFIAFLDADDLWATDKLELQLAALKQNPEAGVAYSWTYFMDVDKQGNRLSLLPSPQYSFQDNVYERLLVSDFIHSGSNTLICREAIDSAGEFDPTLKSCEDWDYWLRLAAKWHFVVVPKYQVLYRRTLGAMSSKVEVMKEAALIAMDKAYRTAPLELQYLKPYTLASFHKYCAGQYLEHCLNINDLRKAQEHLWSVIRLQPKALLDQGTQKLVVKLLLKEVMTPKIYAYLLRLLRKPLIISAQNFQIKHLFSSETKLKKYKQK